MRYGSVCSGIEAATQAWHPLGWKTAFFSDIDSFPRAVLQHHYPDVPLHGDFTTIGAEDYGPIDLLVGGTPCQSFSIAGLRGGLGDDRGNLALEYLRLADRLRPSWLVWENVPGVTSSLSHPAPDPCPPPAPMDMGCDGTEMVTEDEYDSEEVHAFNSFLAGLSEIGYQFAYRIIDAQYCRVDSFPHAVPQRRRRMFVVGHSMDWRRAAAVLFDRESMSGHPAPRREAGEKVAPTISARPTGGGGLGTDFDLDGGLICANSGDVGYCLTAAAQQSLDAETETLIAFNSREDPEVTGDRAGPLTCGTPQAQAVAFDMRGRDGGAQLEGPHDTANMRAASGGSSRSYIAEPWRVRRLMPVECERLQGFPDGYTDIPWRGKDHAPDGRRYKALGNSMAVNAMRWIGDRIALVDAL